MKARLEDVTWPGDASFLVREYGLPAFSVPWHFHPEFELTLILEGEGDRCVGDHLGCFSAGDLVLLGPNLPHYWRSHRAPDRGVPTAAPQARAIVVHLREGVIGNHLLGLPEAAAWKRVLLGAGRGLLFPLATAQRVSSLLRELLGLQEGRRLITLLSVLEELSNDSDSATTLAGERYLQESGRQVQGRMGKVYEYLYAHLDERLHLPDIARVAGMSDAAFSRYCRKVTGRTVTRLIGELRITQVCKKLTDTTMGVAEVAFSSGFQSLSNFNRTFLEIKGLSPQAFRQVHQRSEGAFPHLR